MMSETIKLKELAHARSGDKGAMANIGVIAYSEEGYRHLEQHLTEALVLRFFSELHPSKTTRYALPNLLAFNFLLEEVLDGGGSLSLRCDAQGKALGQALLEIEIPKELP